MTRRTFVVAGAAGFIGSHLTRELLDRGHRVVAVDDLSSGRRENLRVNGHREHLDLLLHDVCDPVDLDEPVDAVLDLASPASPKDYREHPLKTLQVGAFGTQRLLDLAERHDALFLLTSTSEIYGDPEVSPQPEGYWGHVNPVGPRSVYDEAKRFAEALVMCYHRDRNLDTRIARIFNTYGPRMRRDDGRVIPNFLTQALSGQPLTVYGDGSQTRSFCYVDDMVRGLLALVERGDAQPVNLGNTHEVTILELAEVVRDVIDTELTIEHKPLPQDDPQQRCPDITRARETLGWSPQVPLEEGLEATVRAFRDELQEVAI